MNWWTTGESNPAELLRAKQAATPSSPVAHLYLINFPSQVENNKLYDFRPVIEQHKYALARQEMALYGLYHPEPEPTCRRHMLHNVHL